MQVEAVLKDGTIPRGDHRLGLVLDTVERGTHVGQGDLRGQVGGANGGDGDNDR